MAYRKTDSGLTPRQDEFAKLLAIGVEQVAAYRKCFPLAGKSDAAIHQAAHRVAKKPLVKLRSDAWLKEARVTALRSIGEWYAHLQRGIAKAEDEGNWTAFAALMRLDGTALGALAETVNVRSEHSMTDEKLAASIAGRDPALAAKLRSIIGTKKAA